MIITEPTHQSSFSHFVHQPLHFADSARPQQLHQTHWGEKASAEAWAQILIKASLLLALAGGFLECPISLRHWGYFLPILSSTAQCGHGHGETEEKSEGSLERFFWVFLHLGVSQKTLQLSLQSKLSLKAAGHRAHLAQLQTSPCHSSQQYQQHSGVFIWPAYKDFQWQKLHHLSRQSVPALHLSAPTVC